MDDIQKRVEELMDSNYIFSIICPECVDNRNRQRGVFKLIKELAEREQKLVKALEEISEPCYLNLKPTFADVDNVKSIYDGLNMRIELARATLEELKDKTA